MIYLSKKQIGEISNPAFSSAQIAEICKVTPKSEVETNTDENGQRYKTVKGAYMKRRLNQIFGFDWDFSIISQEYFVPSREVIVHGRLTIRSGSKTITREQFGRHYLTLKTTTSGNTTITSAVNIGNGYKAAATDAFKKCASEIGLCWDVYNAEFAKDEEIEAPPELSYADKKQYDRLDFFLSECCTPEQAEEVFNKFRENVDIKDIHVICYNRHLKRILPSYPEFKLNNI